MRSGLIGLLLGISLNAVAVDSPAPTALKYTLSPSNAFSYQTVLKMDGEMRLAKEAPEKLSAELEMRHRMKVLSLDEKSLVFENQLSDLKLKNDGQALNADSAPPVTTVFSERGRLMETRGLENLRLANLPGLDPTTFGSLLYNIPSFPDKPVKAGESWSDEVPVQLPTGQKVAAKRKLTLLSLDKDKDGKETARIQSEMVLPIQVKVEGPNGGILSGSQTGTGESRVSLEDGLPLESRSNMKLQIIVQPSTPTTDSTGKAIDSSVEVITNIQVQARRVPDVAPAPKPAGDKTKNP